MERYEVIDRQTGKMVSGPYATVSRARRRVDTLDGQYGAARYMVRVVMPAAKTEDLGEMIFMGRVRQ